LLFEIRDIKGKTGNKAMHIIQCDILDAFHASAGDMCELEHIMLDCEKLIILLKNSNRLYTEEMLNNMCQTLIDRLSDKYPEINIFTGISTEGTDESELSVKFSECKRAISYIQTLGINSVICFSKIQANEQSYVFRHDMFNLKNLLISAIEDNDNTALEYSIAKITGNAAAADKTEFSFIKRFYVQILFYFNDLRSDLNTDNNDTNNSSLNSVLNIEKMFKGCTDISVLNDILVMSVQNIIKKRNSVYNSNISKHVQSVLDFINDNYTSVITLEDIAVHTHLSIEHICRLFKKEIDKNIIDYMNEFRIKKAKEFLDMDKYKIYEISEMVGIQNPHYFSTLFKKYTGISPTEYIKHRI